MQRSTTPPGCTGDDDDGGDDKRKAFVSVCAPYPPVCTCICICICICILLVFVYEHHVSPYPPLPPRFHRLAPLSVGCFSCITTIFSDLSTNWLFGLKNLHFIIIHPAFEPIFGALVHWKVKLYIVLGYRIQTEKKFSKLIFFYQSNISSTKEKCHYATKYSDFKGAKSVCQKDLRLGGGT